MLAAFASITLCAASLWSLLEARDRALADVEVETRNLVRSFSHHMDRSIRAISVSLDLMVPRLARTLEGGPVDERSIHDFLKAQMDASTHLEHAALVDAQGLLIAGTQRYPIGAVTVADRDYFRFHRTNASDQALLQDPALSRVTGKWIISVSRRISGADGRFLGIVVASIDVDYFVALYRSVTLGDGGMIEVMNARGTVLVGLDVDASGKPSRINPHSLDITAAGGRITSGDYVGADKTIRVGSTGQVESRPLFVSVARSRDSVLAAWRHQAIWQSLALAGVIVVVLCLGALAYRDQARIVRAATAQNQHLELLEALNATTPSAVVAIDAAGKALLYNGAASALFGPLPADDNPSLDLSSAHLIEAGQRLPPKRHPLARALRGETINNFDLIVRRDGADGDRQVVVSARPLRHTGTGGNGAVMACRDVTDYNTARLQLEQSQRLKAVGQLTGGVAHDFNNVLTVIMGGLEMIADDAPLDAEQQSTVADLIRAAERGATLTRSLLSFSRQQALEPRSIDVNTLVGEAVRLLRPTLGERIEISIAQEDGLPPALIDPAQLQTAILNLAINARDAMPGGGRLMIETSHARLDQAYAERNNEVVAGDYVLVAVTDTGTGMTRDVLAKVFEPFFSTKGVGKGTGLGLSMVYGFVRQSGGHVKMYSEPGIGTTVKIYLPVADSPAQTYRVTALRPPKGNGELILVVEDDGDVRSLVCGQLESLNYRTVDAGSGAEGLDLLARHPEISLLFTDVVLGGGMNGAQVAAAAVAARPGLPVLYTSGYTEDAIVHNGRLDAGVRLLSKPYHQIALASAIREALALVAA